MDCIVSGAANSKTRENNFHFTSLHQVEVSPLPQKPISVFFLLPLLQHSRPCSLQLAFLFIWSLSAVCKILFYLWFSNIWESSICLYHHHHDVPIVVVQLAGCVWFSSTSWTVACQASLSLTISQSFLKFMPIALVMPSNYLNLILCHPLLLLPSKFFPASESFTMIQLFTSGIQCTGASASASVLPMNEYSGLISFRNDWFDLLAAQGILKSLL